MTSSQWGICLLGPIIFVAVAELGKLYDRRRNHPEAVVVPAGT